jgi:amino acid adenylation domain-containing protein/non-ribosomal peptide synthase protein (TIGR01720 family)
MTTTLEFLTYLRSLDVRVELDDGHLDVDAPEGVLTAALRAELAERKAELITFLRSAHEAAQSASTIRPAPRDGSLPLSYSQQRMWLMGQFEPNAAVFNAPAAVRLNGPLNVSALEASLNEIARRHEALRTVYISADGQTTQSILPAMPVSLPVIDARDVPEPEREARLRQLCDAEAEKPFDLTRGPLLRAGLLRAGEEAHVLLLTLHHIASDDWSLNVFMRELAALYEAYAAGSGPAPDRGSPLADLPVQYADFAVWQREWVKSDAAQSQLEYWKERLGDVASAPEIPTDHPHPPEQSGKRERCARMLPVALSNQLKALSQREESTLFMTLLAAFQALLHQYAAQTDIVVASPAAGRMQRELEGLIGFFVNTVILRTDLSADPTFHELLGRVREVTSGAHAHQDVPFEEVARALHLEAGAGQFRVFFNMLGAAAQAQTLTLSGLETKPFRESLVRAPEIGGGFDLTLIAAERQDGIHLDASFNADRYEKRTIAWLLAHLQTLLESIAADPQQRLSALPPLVAAEHERVEPANVFEPFAKAETEQSLVERFEKQVERDPDRVAVDVNGRTLSYDELNRRANRMARVLAQTYEDRFSLSRKEKTRYARQMLIGGWGVESQEKLKSKTAFVAGSGGCAPLLMQLALAGFGKIITVDFDEVELSNLNRQFLHNESRIGMNKALSSKKTLDEHGVNPHVEIIALPMRITRDNVYDMVGDADILFDLVDDLETKFALGECAVAKGIPMMLASMIDLSSYACILYPPESPCFRCLYDRNKLIEIEEIRSYKVKKAPQPVVSPSMFLSCSFVANEALKIVLGLGDVAYNKYFFFNQRGSDLASTLGHPIITFPFSEHFRRICREQGFDWDKGWSGKFVEELTLERDPDCPICGDKARAQGKSRFSIPIKEALPHRDEPAASAKDRTVALLLGHDDEMLTGMMGTLKAGMIFVALDENYPDHRLIAMLEDSEARVIVANDDNLALAERIRDRVNKHIQIVNIRQVDGSVSDENLGTYPQPDQPAYVVYTSGSMGKPKGVVQNHRNVLHFIMNYTNGLHISKDDKLSLIPTFSFSAAMMDTFAALLNGASLCPFDLRQDGVAALGSWLAKNDITVYHSVPTVFRHFVSTFTEDAVFPRLRLIDFGGEPVSRADVDLYRKYFSPDCILVNGLGATELNVIRQYYIGPQTRLTGNNVPVGYAVEDTEILLLNEGQPVGFNRPGEIVIRSQYLSPGYWQSQEQTDAAFKPDPRGGRERLCYTGDLGRMRPDGCLEHLGRKDLQVKIRGVRIELAEIEAALSEIDAVREAAVVARENEAGEKILVAYVVPSGEEAAFPVDVVRSALLEQLPAYMLPSEFVLLPALPLTPTGKIDRRALLATAGTGVAHSNALGYVAPRTPAEKALAEAWSQILGIQQVGLYDSFFDLGGDSLLALHAIDRIRQAGLYLTLPQLFQHPTIAELAALASAAPVLVTEQEIITGLVPLDPPQAWFFRTYNVNPGQYSLCVCVEVDQPLDTDLLFRTLQHLLTHHDILRARFIATEQGWQQTLVSPDEVSPVLSIYDFSALPPERHNESTIQVALEMQDSYRLSTPPLIRVAYLNLGAQSPARVLIGVHHLVMDGFSMDIILKDIQSIYMQLVAGQPVSLPPKTVAFKTYAENILQYARTVAMNELGYWLHLPWQRVKPLPMDKPENRMQDTYARMQFVPMELGVADTQALLRAVKAQASAGVQITEFLLTALALAFKQWKGIDTLWITSANTGRSAPLDHLDLSRTVGWIGTTAHFLLDVGNVNNPTAALSTVKQQISAAPGGGLGYELLTYLADDAESAEEVKPILAIPKTHAMFNYMGDMYSSTQDQSFGLRSVPGLSILDSISRERNDLRFHALLISGTIMENSMTFKFIYGPDVFHQVTMETLAALYRQNLLELIAACSTTIR